MEMYGTPPIPYTKRFITCQLSPRGGWKVASGPEGHQHHSWTSPGPFENDCILETHCFIVLGASDPLHPPTPIPTAHPPLTVQPIITRAQTGMLES